MVPKLVVPVTKANKIASFFPPFNYHGVLKYKRFTFSVSSESLEEGKNRQTSSAPPPPVKCLVAFLIHLDRKFYFIGYSYF